MFMSRESVVNGCKPRPPVPPRPNKIVLDEAIAKSKTKTTVVTPDGVITVTKNGGPHFKSNLNGSLKNGHQARVNLGQHVHENDPMFRQNGHRRPTVLLIANGKTLVQDEFKKEPKPQFQVGTLPATKEFPPKIKHSNWYQVEEESGRPVKFSSCQITLDGSSSSSPITQRLRAASMSSLQGLPPLPKSLSGINLLDSVKANAATTVKSDSPRSSATHQLRIPSTPPPPPPSEPKKQPPPLPTPRKMTTLDTQLAILRKEMYSLRELDLNLLSQLWSLNESIQEFRQIQEALSPPSPSSDAEDEAIYSNLTSLPEHPLAHPYPLSSSSSRSSTMDLGDV